jgi:hypothetical protein
MGEFTLDSILGESEVDALFSTDENEIEDANQNPQEEKTEETKDKEQQTAEVNPLDLFEDTPESVGGGSEEEDTAGNNDTGGSPQSIYSSIAEYLKEGGIFSNLDDDNAFKGIESAEDLDSLIESEIDARMGERERRINDALNSGMPQQTVANYEGAIEYLKGITEEQLTEESEEGEALRRELIYHDLVNQGFSEERAKKKTDRIMESGTDIDEAKEALESNREFYQNEYKKQVELGKKQIEDAKKENERRIESLKKDIMESKNLLGLVEADSKLKTKIVDNITKASYQDKETGRYFTPLQKYMNENGDEFMKNVGIIYTITNGFKDFDKLVTTKVNKEVKRSVKDIERKLSNMRRDGDGNLLFVNNEDTQTKYSNITLDI